MLNLVRNENMKIYPRLRTWILLGILCVALILVAWVLHNQQHVDPNWKQSLAASNVKLQQTLAQAKRIPAATVNSIKEQIVVNQYDLRHNIDPNLFNAWSFTATAMNLSPLLIAFIVVVAGDVVAGEFSSGTIKMLLTQTATRSKILTSKYLAALLFSLFMTLSMLILSVVIGGCFFGFGGADMPQVYSGANQVVHQMSAASFLLMQYGFLFIRVMVTATIAFMISAIFRSSALAITVSILTYLVGITLVKALSSYSWVKYILFANTDLSQYVVGGPLLPGMTLGFSITMLLAYLIVMNGLAWLVFVKRDVAYT